MQRLVDARRRRREEAGGEEQRVAGRKKPISSPDSAKTIAKMPSSPTVSMRRSGSRKPPAAKTEGEHRARVTRAPPAGQITRLRSSGGRRRVWLVRGGRPRRRPTPCSRTTSASVCARSARGEQTGIGSGAPTCSSGRWWRDLAGIDARQVRGAQALRPVRRSPRPADGDGGRPGRAGREPRARRRAGRCRGRRRDPWGSTSSRSVPLTRAWSQVALSVSGAGAAGGAAARGATACAGPLVGPQGGGAQGDRVRTGHRPDRRRGELAPGTALASSGGAAPVGRARCGCPTSSLDEGHVAAVAVLTRRALPRLAHAHAAQRAPLVSAGRGVCRSHGSRRSDERPPG